MATFKTVRTQAQQLLNLHRDDSDMREVADLILNLTRVCSELQRQVKSLENELRVMKRNETS